MYAKTVSQKRVVLKNLGLELFQVSDERGKASCKKIGFLHTVRIMRNGLP